jgi:hypothetical protein
MYLQRGGSTWQTNHLEMVEARKRPAFQLIGVEPSRILKELG